MFTPKNSLNRVWLLCLFYCQGAVKTPRAAAVARRTAAAVTQARTNPQSAPPKGLAGRSKQQDTPLLPQLRSMGLVPATLVTPAAGIEVVLQLQGLGVGVGMICSQNSRKMKRMRKNTNPRMVSCSCCSMSMILAVLTSVHQKVKKSRRRNQAVGHPQAWKEGGVARRLLQGVAADACARGRAAGVL